MLPSTARYSVEAWLAEAFESGPELGGVVRVVEISDEEVDRVGGRSAMGVGRKGRREGGKDGRKEVSRKGRVQELKRLRRLVMHSIWDPQWMLVGLAMAVRLMWSMHCMRDPPKKMPGLHGRVARRASNEQGR